MKKDKRPTMTTPKPAPSKNPTPPPHVVADVRPGTCPCNTTSGLISIALKDGRFMRASDVIESIKRGAAFTYNDRLLSVAVCTICRDRVLRA